MINFFLNYSLFSFLFLSIVSYYILLLLLFSFLFLFDLRFLKTLSDFKKVYDYSYYSWLFILIILSLSGTPPFLFFFIKIYSLLFFSLFNNFFLLLLYFIFNSFLVYFYIQNLKFFKSVKKNNIKIFYNYYNYNNFYLLNIILILIFFNIFGFFFIEDVYYLAYIIFIF